MYIKPLNTRTKGILFIILSAIAFSFMSFFVRLSGDVPFYEKAVFRNLIAAIVSFLLLKRSGHRITELDKSNYLPLLLRSILGSMGILFNFYAISHLQIGDANILNKMAPFFAILMSIPLLGEFPKKMDLLTVFIALIGALFVIKPSGSMSSFPAFIGLMGGLCAGSAYTFVRKLTQNGVYGAIIIFVFSSFSVLVCLVPSILYFEPLSLKAIFYLLMAGLSASIAQFTVTKAYSYAPAKEISVFDYTQVLFASILGIVFLNEVPDLFSLIGYLIIIGAAVLRYVLTHRC